MYLCMTHNLKILHKILHANISKSSLNIAVILSICLWATSLTIDI